MTETDSVISKQRFLSMAMLQYGFADVTTDIDKIARRRVKQQLHQDKAIISGRKLRQSVRSAFLGLEHDIDAALNGKTYINKNITKMLLLTHPSIVEDTKSYISNINTGFTTAEIAKVLERPTEDVSKRIYEFRTRAPGKILVHSSNRRTVIRLQNKHIGGRSQYKWSVVLESTETFTREKALYIIIITDMENFNWRSFFNIEGQHDVIDEINTWNPLIFEHHVSNVPFVDIICVYENHAKWTRYYREPREFLKIFESRAIEARREFEAKHEGW